MMRIYFQMQDIVERVIGSPFKREMIVFFSSISCVIVRWRRWRRHHWILILVHIDVSLMLQLHSVLCFIFIVFSQVKKILWPKNEFFVILKRNSNKMKNFPQSGKKVSNFHVNYSKINENIRRLFSSFAAGSWFVDCSFHFECSRIETQMASRLVMVFEIMATICSSF